MLDPEYINDAIFVNGDSLKLAHGTYPAKMLTSAWRALAGKDAIIPEKLVIYWPDDHPYPIMSQLLVSRDALPPLGGVKADADYPEVGTFGVYRRGTLVAWYDFDHWPVQSVDGTFSLVAGLADGHYHRGADTKPQISCDGRERALYIAVALFVRAHGG